MESRITRISEERGETMDFDFGIAGKKYLVTGASSGIGQAAAILISKLGGTVILNGRNEERLNQTLSQMEGTGHHIMPFDLTNLEGIKQYIKTCVDVDSQRFDGMVFSMGIAGGGLLKTESVEEYHRQMLSCYYPYAAILKEFSSRRILNDGGAIVALSSKAALYPDKSSGSYACSKAAMDTLSEVAAKEFCNRMIRVNTIRPEEVKTPMTENYFSNVPQATIDKHYPLGYLHVEDVANVILFLLSDLSRKISGQHIYVGAGNFGYPIDSLV